MKIVSTTLTQSSNELLGKKENTLYYLIIENSLGTKMTINVGKKTHDKLVELSLAEKGVKK